MAKTAWDTSHIHIEVNDQNEGQIRARITGNATSCGCPAFSAMGTIGHRRVASRGFGGISGSRGGRAAGRVVR
ncbi:hypothetical protein GCM10010298_50830 [Streptomyces microflavus]|uniref:Uncharacterized protein n=1 Tax=Streptomyces microflavus TaxID=1919 RepID=A0A7J0CIF2_STRMI|nr:hypothetical protein Smic_08020 [Streptomyces microflavus]GGX79303.1 hypothetical protein GCM10010298_50830 [Streptomyces microflavus]